MNERLVDLRKNHLHLSQEEFAKKINLSRSQVGSIEIGARAFTDRTISDICREFNVNEDWLRTGEGPMFRPVKTIDNELVIEIGKLIKTDDEFTKQCVLQYLKLSDEAKGMFKQFLTSIVGDGVKNERN